MISIVFYSLTIVGIVIAVKPLIDLFLTFIRDTWDKYQEWDKIRIKNWMDAYHRGEDNYEFYDTDESESIWRGNFINKDMIKADYPCDKYDDPFYIEERK